jgi:hypothetical protein
MSDPEAKRTMFRIVSDYERLAMLNCGRERNHPRPDDAGEQRDELAPFQLIVARDPRWAGPGCRISILARISQEAAERFLAC